MHHYLAGTMRPQALREKFRAGLYCFRNADRIKLNKKMLKRGERMTRSISRQDAMEIVTQINSVIEDRRVNIMNSEGIIVGSTDPKRIGTFHEGAWLIVENRLPELIIHSDTEYKGCRAGMNFPIVVEEEIVGVVGVTGDYESGEKYGQIIKTMTEILIHGKITEQERQKQEHIRMRFLEEWFSGEVRNINRRFIDRGLSLGIDLTVPRRMMALCVYDPELREEPQIQNLVAQGEDYVCKLLEKADHLCVIYRSASYLFCGVGDRTDEEIERLALSVTEELWNRYRLKLAVGIDSRNRNYLLMHQAYIRSKKAVDACIRTHKWDLRFYDDLNMEIFSEEIPTSVKQEFVRRVFKGYTDQEIAGLVRLLETFLDEEGSINRTADKLFMHKNTLQYKLKKIEEKTGYDPRSIRHSSLFYIAIYFYREIRDTMTASGEENGLEL